MAEKYVLERHTARITDLEAYREECVDVEKFLACCARCGNYNARWSCPPFDFDPLSVWSRYDTLTLYAKVLRPLPGATFREMMEGMTAEHRSFLEELMELERAAPGSYALSAGSCSLCEKCSRPEGEPCRHPEKLRCSIEALGGDVGKTVERYLHLPLAWAKAGEVADHYCLVGGLLTKEECL